MALGGESTCALFADAPPSCWGRNARGQLADGTTVDRGSPYAAPALAGVTTVALGAQFGCAHTAAGAVVCWGDNAHGQLGDASGGARALPDEPVEGIDGATDVAVGEGFACAALDDGAVRCWGSRDLPGAERTESLPDLAPAVALAAAGTNVCSRSAAGVVRCVEAVAVQGALRAAAVRVPALANATQLAAGATHRCAVTEQGTVMCAGDNSHGQLGDPSGAPHDDGWLVGTSGVEVAVGDAHSCLRARDGEVMCWGYDLNGQTGDRERRDRAAPAWVAQLEGALQIAAAGYQTCARLRDGTVRCLTGGGPGQTMLVRGVTGATGVTLGAAESCALLADRTVRCWTATATRAIEGLGDVAQVALSSQNGCARTTAGGVYCWGVNDRGQLGAGVERALLPRPAWW
jgi:alpha-tubulin suppressor-like RCC1 family protein